MHDSVENKSKAKNRLVLLVLLLLLLAGSLVILLMQTSLFDKGAAPQTLEATYGKAEDFSLPNLYGETVSLSDFRGQPVVLTFWRSDCGGCLLEMPYLLSSMNDFPKQFELLAVNVDEDPDYIAKFIVDQGFSRLPVLFDVDGSVYTLYNLRSLPVTFFIDATGEIIKIHPGSLDGATLKTYLQSLGVTP